MCKKAIAFMLALALVIACVPKVAFAASSASANLNVADVYATPGSTVTVAVEIGNNPGILGATLTVSWDEGLTLIEGVSGEAFSELTYQAPSRYVNGCNFVWYGSAVKQVKDGNVLLLTFQVEEAAEEAKVYGITVTYDSRDILDRNYNTVELNINNGSVRIVTYKPGDVTGDDRVNPLDLIKLSQYISDGGKTDPDGFNVTINTNAADVNDDDRINPLDLILISQYISDGCETVPSGYNVELKPHTPRCEHKLQATEAKEPTCTENGNRAYWYCVKCEKYFSNAAGSVEIDQEDAFQEALGHNVVIIPGKEATKTETGLTDGRACDREGCDYVEVPQEVIPVITGYAIAYEVANGDDYISKNKPIVPAEKMQYYEDTGIELPQLEVPGYRFIGWSYSQASSENIVTEIPKGTTGEKKLYAHWDKITYYVDFDSPDIPWDSISYTVDTGATLTNPKWFGYTFVGWSNDDGFIVNRIKPGTTGNITLHANWTSDRNKATSYQDYGTPIIIEDDVRKQFLFVYNIGKIDNVPLNEVEFIGKSDGLDYNKEVEVVDTVNSTLAENVNSMVAEATTRSSGWTLSEDWNDLYSIQEETGYLQGYSDERTTSEGKTVGGKYFVSNSEGGSSHVSTESGSSASSSAKVTTEDSFGINSSYDAATEKYCDTKLGVKNETEVSAGVKVKYGLAEANAGVKNTTTVSAETSSGRKDNTAFHVDSSVSGYVGTVTNNESSSYINSAVSNSSNWNSTNGYESSNELFQEETVKKSVDEQISTSTTHNLSKALGGSNSNTSEMSELKEIKEEYNNGFTYSQGTQTSVKKTLQFSSSESGYYRIITAGTVHVFGVVGYDVATASYFTYCYNVLDDTTREIMDYSKDNGNFDDCENSVVCFNVPYAVNEYIANVTGQTDGVEISYDGEVTDFVPTEDFLSKEVMTPEGDVVEVGFDGTVVIPQYVGKDNEDGSRTAVKVTSLNPEVFKGAKADIRVVVLPIYIAEIPDRAFEGCTNLETVIAYGVTSIGDYAFKDCTSLKKFYIDNKITHLGVGAFENAPEVAVAAYDSEVADAAIASGAKNITLNISYITDTYENKTIEIEDTAESFTLIGNGSTYSNVELDSAATKSTMVSNMVFANNTGTPLKIASEQVTLARVTVENSPSFALILTGENANVKLLGTVSLNSANENAVLSRAVVLSQLQQETTSKMVVSGKFLTCGTVSNAAKYLNVEPIEITDDEFKDYLVSCFVTFDPNGGTVELNSKVVYENKAYGVLPVPEKQYYAFLGWYTEAEGGNLVTAETVVEKTDNHTLYAHWEAMTAVLQFNANGGSVSLADKTVYIGAAVGDLPTPIRAHYTFRGWYTSADGGTKITAESAWNTAGVATLYAQWDLVPYTVSWQENNDCAISVSRTSSPNAGAATGTLSNGATIYYGDVLSVSYTPDTGYYIVAQGKTSVTVEGNVTAADIYVGMGAYAYTSAWNSGTGYTITVNRMGTHAGASIGVIQSGTTVYHHDVLSITYTAAAGYTITGHGATSITVSGHITASDIYAVATPNSYTYNIVYRSSNGTALGSSSATFKYGTTNTVSAPAITGYNTPASQTVVWDSTSAKTITFTYSPTPVATSQQLTSGTWWDGGNGYGITYSVKAEYQNRTANSVQVRIVWTQTIKGAAYGYNQYFTVSFWRNGSELGKTGSVLIASSSTWPYYSSSGPWHNASVTSSSGWVTLPLDTTGATDIYTGGGWWTDGASASGEWRDLLIHIPAF